MLETVLVQQQTSRSLPQEHSARLDESPQSLAAAPIKPLTPSIDQQPAHRSIMIKTGENGIDLLDFDQTTTGIKSEEKQTARYNRGADKK
ncbi:hypothetical protein ElyMa_002117200 [Elysia marginata]|uniref:Uncharacterized protein n=1 Tax=Elysia marginata TaxID=1093978 RepID=A0AAV4FH74_9GAST|nr:hypothetical protein ElyMa_002117200 [Elysia marginata]